jgi:hypothetical protein
MQSELKKRAFVLISWLLFASASPALADDDLKSDIKGTAKDIGHTFKNAGTEVGHAFKKSGSDVVHAAKRTAHAAAQRAKKPFKKNKSENE